MDEANVVVCEAVLFLCMLVPVIFVWSPIGCKHFISQNHTQGWNGNTRNLASIRVAPGWCVILWAILH